MADMREIFTYPLNLGTDYIDPNWVGTNLIGFERRIDELLDGTYKAWLNPLTLTATTSEVMQNLSKFGNFYESVSAAGHLSRYDFWNQPMVIATKKLIDSENVTANVQNTPMVVTTSNAHEFEDGQRIATSGIDGTWGIDITAGNLPELYAKVISTTELQVSTTEDLTNIVGYVGGALTFTLAGGALVGTSIFTMNGAVPSVYAQQNAFDFATVNLSSIVGGFNISITDATPIVFVSSNFTNDTVIPGTYYLMNTPTSGTDHIYMLYPEVGLNQSAGNSSQMRFSGAGSNMFQFPINPNSAGTDSLGKITATIGETNPGTIITSRALNADELTVFVPQSEIVTWGNGRTFGPNGITNRNTAANPHPLETNAASFKLDATGNTNEYSVYFQASSGSNSGYVDWTVQSFNDSNSLVGFYSKPQLSATYPWATVNNVRIRWNLGGLADNYVDGTPISFNTTNQMENNPYYLKEVVASSTATYKIYDVYKNAALTNIVGPEEYNVPTATFTYVSNAGAGTQIVFTEGNNTNNWPALSTTVVAAEPYSNWGIAQDEELQLVWNQAASTLTVANKSPTNLFLNDTYNGAPTLTETVSYDYSGGTFDGQTRFWVLSTLLDEIAPGGTFIFNMSAANSATNPGTTYTSNLLLTSGQTFTVSTQTLTRGNGDVWKLVYGGTWRTSSASGPNQQQVKRFNPEPGQTIGRIRINNNATLLSYEEAGFDVPNSFTARNGTGYPTFTFQTATAAPANYTGLGNYYWLTQSGAAGLYEVYNDRARTTPSFNFSSSSRPYTGVTNSVDPTGDNYPTGIDITGTNLKWQAGSIDWHDGQNIQLTMNNTGGTAFVKTVYVKIAVGVAEFYTDAMTLLVPYTTADFISDWAPYIDASDTGTLSLLTQEPVKESGASLYTFAPFTTSPFSGLAESSSSFKFHTWILEANTFTENDYPSTTTTAIVPINPSVSTTLNLPLTNTTTGQVGPYVAAASMPYEINTVTLLLPGNQKYNFKDASNVTTPGAKTNTNKYWNAGGTTELTYNLGATSATFATTVDSSGFLQTVTLTEEPDAEGRYPDGEDIIVLIENKADVYVPTVLPSVYDQDIFDTHDEWLTNSYNALKQWPSHITPSDANIVYNSPTMVNMSQNGVKYTRSSLHTKWVLEVEYPGMKAKDFQKFHAIAQAAKGQSAPFLFNLRNKDGVSLIWADMMATGSSLSGITTLATDIGYSVLSLEGLTASDPEAFREGEVFISSENENGNLHTAIGAAASNVYGEAKVRMPWPLRTSVLQSDLVYKNPANCVVTLNSDNFEYTVDVNNYYYVTVAFDLDSWG